MVQPLMNTVVTIIAIFKEGQQISFQCRHLILSLELCAHQAQIQRSYDT